VPCKICKTLIRQG